MEIFNITFDKPSKCYVSGETIHLHLHIYVPEKFKAHSLSMEIRGWGHTEWLVSRSEMINAKTSAAPNKYVGFEKYFTHTQFLVGGDHSGPKEIQAGTYHYDVLFTLPVMLPDSFEHQLGHIRYMVQANYNILRGFDKTYSEIFYVTSEIDLNQCTELCNPVRKLKEISFGFNCFCFSEPLQLIIFLPKKGFTPGEAIPITIEIDNMSNTRFNFIKIELIERLTFVATIPRVVQECTTTVLETRQLDAVVAPYQNKIFQTKVVLDPDLMWKIFEGSMLFYCDYVIRVEASRMQTVGLSKNPAVEAKIQIGTIPIVEKGSKCNENDQARLPSYSEVSNLPPTFDECQRGSK